MWSKIKKLYYWLLESFDDAPSAYYDWHAGRDLDRRVSKLEEQVAALKHPTDS